MTTATLLQSQWDQKDAAERERLVANPKSLDVLCRINEFLVGSDPEELRNAPPLLLLIVHSAAMERLSMLTLSAIARNED